MLAKARRYTRLGALELRRMFLARVLGPAWAMPAVEVEWACAEQFLSNSDNPVLVSFPRTGSHWLRMMVELYFQRPTLVEVYFYPQKRDYLLLHTHDMPGENVDRTNVIYLYRDPVPTVYSQLRYEDEDPHDEARIRHWASIYRDHLVKWLIDETSTSQKTVVAYERLLSDYTEEMGKVVKHLGGNLDPARLEMVSSTITKELLTSKIKHHDSRVLKYGAAYDEGRAAFRASMGHVIWDEITATQPALKPWFTHLGEFA